MNKTPLQKILPIVGVIAGIASIIIGFTCSEFNFYYSGTVSKESYGGDAYTGIQNASAQTATNVFNVYQCLQAFCKYFFILFGVILIIHYLDKAITISRECKND